MKKICAWIVKYLTLIIFAILILFPVYVVAVGSFKSYGYMQSLPWEIQEAAIVDGCNLWRLYWQVAMPLSKNAIATVLIFDMVTVWNDMLFPLMLISKEKLRTLPFGLLQFRGQYSSQYTVIFAGVILITIPLIVLYLTMQKQFVSGMTQGAVKG